MVFRIFKVRMNPKAFEDAVMTPRDSKKNSCRNKAALETVQLSLKSRSFF